MARIWFKDDQDFVLRLSKLAGEAADEAIKRAVYEGTAVIADQIRKNLTGVLSDEATGDLVESFGVTPIEQDDEGNWNAKIGFDGYDRTGTANQLKARALESGTTTQPKHPFVRPAVDAKRKEAQQRMEQVLVEELQKIM